MIWNINEIKIGIVGYGSWATAIVHLIAQKGLHLDWWVKNSEDLEHIKSKYVNPRYLSSTRLSVDYINPLTDIKEVINNNDYIFLITPSAYLAQTLSGIHSEDLINKNIISSIKGLDPKSQLLISEYFKENFHISNNQFCVLSGPSHAEEVSQQKTTYLTSASENETLSAQVADIIRTPFIHTLLSDDVVGIEVVGILKNIYTIGIGIALGLGYMDNFIAAFVCACLREIDLYLHKISPNHSREITHSVYLGDFLTTSYSPFSRNRKFGFLIGSGESIDEAIQNMNMVAEGYNSTKIMVEKRNLHYTIAQAVYDILFKFEEPRKIFKNIENIII